MKNIIYKVLDWLTEKTDKVFADERGQYVYSPWHIFICVVAFCFALGFSHFLFGFPR